MKYADLKCEFCDGHGEFSRDNSDGVAVEGDCSYCNGTGIDQDQLKSSLDSVAYSMFKTDYKYVGLDNCKVAILESILNYKPSPPNK